MKPVTVSTEVPAPPERVFEHLDTLANHEAFLDHYLEKWKFSGPASGLGAKAEALAKAPGSQDWFDFEVVEREPPWLLVEEAVSSGGKRKTRGTYRLSEAGGGTTVELELEFLELPRSERLAPFLTRAFAKRVNAKALRRLAKQLDG
jgi:uncharacterized protein YndB with AHSA1/START domain